MQQQVGLGMGLGLGGLAGPLLVTIPVLTKHTGCAVHTCTVTRTLPWVPATFVLPEPQPRPPPHPTLVPPSPRLCSGKCEDRPSSGCQWTADITNKVPCTYCITVGGVGMLTGLFSIGLVPCLSSCWKSVSARAHSALRTLIGSKGGVGRAGAAAGGWALTKC